MPPIPIPANAHVTWTSKKISVGPGGEYHDEHAGIHIKGPYEGKVSDVDIELRLASSARVRGAMQSAAAGLVAPPGVEVAFQVPTAVVSGRPRRIALTVSERRTHRHVPVTSYGQHVRFQYAEGAALVAQGLASAPEGATWVGFQIRDIDFSRFLAHYKPTDVYFTVGVELMGVSHRVFGTAFRGALALLDGATGEASLAYVSEPIQTSPRGWLAGEVSEAPRRPAKG